MYCQNCGKNINDDMVCPNCGYIVDGVYRKNVEKNKNNINGIISLIFGIISILICFNFILKDISSVGMYTKIIDRFNYAIDLILAPACLSFITLIISLVNRDYLLNKFSILLSIFSFIFIFTEIVIVLIY